MDGSQNQRVITMVQLSSNKMAHKHRTEKVELGPEKGEARQV